MPSNPAAPRRGVKVFYSPRYEVALPGHVWPTSKYRLMPRQLRGGRPYPLGWIHRAAAGIVGRSRAGPHPRIPRQASQRDAVTEDDIATLELPWQPEFADGVPRDGGRHLHGRGAALDDGRCGAPRRRPAPRVSRSRRRVLPAQRRRRRDSRPAARWPAASRGRRRSATCTTATGLR